MRAQTLKTLFSLPLSLAILAIVLILGTTTEAQSGQANAVRQHMLTKPRLGFPNHFENLSPMGAVAFKIQQAQIPGTPANKPDLCFGGDEDCSNTGFSDGPGATQSELSVAIDRSGRHIVVGFNDFRGFSLPTTSVSGFAYSDDGGETFTDGGQLPTTGPTATGLVFGDPDVKFVPGGAGCQFVYSSIFVNAHNVQTMSVHRSTDCGHTWTGPFEVTAATSPTTTHDAADKEFMGVDPDTGRVGLSWSNFSTASVEIRFTYSDNIMTATPPTWSTGVVLNPGATTVFDTGSMPRFADDSQKVYVAWSSQSTFYTAQVQVAVSNDNGSTFGPPVTLDQSTLILPTFFIDSILGNDRVHQFPSVAIDNSSGPNRGTVYVVYATNADFDGADVVVHRSTDGGVTWSEPTVLSSRPGADRAQWFPTIAVDRDTGRVNVVYDDQGVATSGDLMEMTWLHSDDGGESWSKPSPITRPFHAGYGNDTSQPNLGDYNASVAQHGTLYTVFTAVPNRAGFTDGEPGRASFPYPSFLGNTVAGGTAPAPGFVKIRESVASLHLGKIAFKDSGGNGIVDAGDVLAMSFPLTNYVTNPATSPGPYSDISADLSTSTPGVTILQDDSEYPTIASGKTATNFRDFLVYVSPGFVPGTPIDFSLKVRSREGETTLLYSQATGTPVPATLLSENFDEVAPGTLPVGWTKAHGGGANTVPWTTNNTFCGNSSNAAFHQDVIDNGTGDPTRWERLFSPVFAVPANSQYVTLDMDVCYDTEDDPLESILGYDGLLLRIFDATAGHLARSVFPEAFEESFTTGNIDFYPKFLPRNGNPRYFQDASAWSGSSGGRHFDNTVGLFLHNTPVQQHVHMKLPGMAGVNAQLRFEYTQDSSGTCIDVGGGPVCGVQVDNIVVQSVVTKSDELAFLILHRQSDNTWSGIVVSQPIAGAGGIAVNLASSIPAKTTITPPSVVIPAGSQTSPSFTVTLDPSLEDVDVMITATGPSNARSKTIEMH
jgi:hypothetical protein